MRLGRGLLITLALFLGALALVALGAGPIVRTAAGAIRFDIDPQGEPRLPPLAEPSRIEAADGTLLAHVGQHERHPVVLDEIPEHVQAAAIAAEDRRFHEHDGYDVEGIGRALVENLRARGIVQGGSTITQQIARANFLDDEQTLRRKIQEIVHAVALEERFTKEELLERYLNEVYFGAGAYGIQAAAQEYFRVDAQDLTVDQAALLVGLIRAPSSLNPRERPDAAQLRRDSVLTAMAEEGLLEEEAAAELSDEDLDVAEPRTEEIREPFVVEEVERIFLRSPAFGGSEEERAELLYEGGLTIRSNIDLDRQEDAREIIGAAFEDGGPTAALVSMDPRDGAVRTMYAGADYDQTQFNLVTQGRRQPGSAFKPLVLAAALEQGIPIDRELEGQSEATFDGVPGWDEEGEGVRNFGGTDHDSPDMREALVQSVNTAFAELVLDVGPADVADLAGRLGIDVESAIGPEPSPAIALGGLGGGVTPLEIAGTFATIANEGVHVPPAIIAYVEDREGQEIYRADTEGRRAMERDVALVTTDVMRDVVLRGTGTAAELTQWDPAGKTGTTQDNADAWFVGSVPVLTTAVWVGHPEGRVEMPGVTGGQVPAGLWAQFMDRALEDEEPVGFPEVDIPDTDEGPEFDGGLEVDEGPDIDDGEPEFDDGPDMADS